MKNNIDFSTFKARASMTSTVVAENSQSKQLTELQKNRIKELEAKDKITDKQKLELAELLLKAENSKKILLSDGYIGYLMEEYAYITEGMVKVDKDFEGLQMLNGTLVEADSIITLREATGKLYMPNINDQDEQDRVFNEYLSGCPDAYLGNSLMEAEEIPDIKSRFDYPTFLNKIHIPITKAERYQVATYCLITGAKTGFIADCLSNVHDEVKEGLKYRLFNKMQGKAATQENPEFLKKWAVIEKSCNFSGINPKNRVYKRNVELFTEHETQFLYDQVKRGRDFLNNFHEQRLQLIN